MWQFGAGMFLVTIDPNSLRLNAIYGFASGGSILLFGAVIGDWVDRSPRLYGEFCYEVTGLTFEVL